MKFSWSATATVVQCERSQWLRSCIEGKPYKMHTRWFTEVGAIVTKGEDPKNGRHQYHIANSVESFECIWFVCVHSLAGSVCVFEWDVRTFGPRKDVRKISSVEFVCHDKRCFSSHDSNHSRDGGQLCRAVDKSTRAKKTTSIQLHISTLHFTVYTRCRNGWLGNGKINEYLSRNAALTNVCSVCSEFEVNCSTNVDILHTRKSVNWMIKIDCNESEWICIEI